MQISESYETPEGVVKFQGEISGAELNLVLQAGFLTLMQKGVIKATVAKPVDEEPLH